MGFLADMHPGAVVTVGLEIVVLLMVALHMLHLDRGLRQMAAQFAQMGGRITQLEALIEKVVDKVNELERAELLQALVSTAQNAQHSLIHYTYTFRLPSEEAEMGPLLEVLEKTTLPRDCIRFLGPDSHTRLNRLYSRKKTGIRLRVNHEIKNSDLRFQVADGRHVVVTIGGASEASRRGFLIDSVFLASILTSWFDIEWGKSIEYDEFVMDLVLTAASVPQIAGHLEEARIEYASKRLGLDLEEVRRLWEKLKQKNLVELLPAA